MLYPQNQNKELSSSLFQNPTCEYRGTPFWAWNCKLEKETILEQIDMMKTMGMGGFHVHVRTGMATEYMSDEFMDLVRTALDKGKKEMLTWLYQEKAEFIAAYDIHLNADGTLAAYRQIGEQDSAEGDKWYAYLVEGSPSGWFNDQTYADTMNSAAIAEFIRTSYESYAAHFKKDFGGAILAIFTDEPQCVRKSNIGLRARKKRCIPALDLRLCRQLQSGLRAGYSGGPSRAVLGPAGRQSVHHPLPLPRPRIRALCQCLLRYVGSWCAQNGLSLTGHVMKEETLESQTSALGETMRCYRSFQLPGIDMLCNRHEYNTAKQCQSAVRQQGAEGMMSELYGVNGWDFDFRGHKLHGDWQAALGVTVRVPHLTWMSMKGEAKRDYPACIGYQSPWYDQYALVEDHFSRVNTAMTRGKPMVSVAVVHPIESYRSTTLERLDAFQKASGRLIFLGECPTLVDAVESCAVRPIYEMAERVSFDAASVLLALEPQRILDVRLENGARAGNLVHQLRRDGDNLWLFVAMGKDPSNPDVDEGAQRIRFTLKGEYTPVLYDTLTGEIGCSAIQMTPMG